MKVLLYSLPHLFLCALVLCLGSNAIAQAPQQFSFQGVARGADGKVVANTQIALRSSILEGSPAGLTKFQQTLTNVQTNGTGVFNISIGSSASPVKDINWSNGTYFLKTEISTDPSTPSDFADLGAVQLLSVPYALNASEADRWKQNTPIIQEGIQSDPQPLPNVGSGPRLIWYPGKAAFRVGFNEFDRWEDSNIGVYSFAAGAFPLASGLSAVAIGQEAIATNQNSIALGIAANATGVSAIAIGHGAVSKAKNSVVIGPYNNDDDVPTGADTDRLVQIGNGSGGSRSNAFTILRNGNIGIGNKALVPSYILDIGGRPRIRNAGGFNTAGLYLNDSQQNADNFVGMISDNEIGFYLNDVWRFWVNNSNAFVNGALVNTSDGRLKKSLKPLAGSLGSLSNLIGYHYYWKNPNQGTDLQTGLIAQEVGKYFPELVVTDQKGYKAVNYTGLIPHLIEAMKELDQKTARLELLIEQLSTKIVSAEKQ